MFYQILFDPLTSKQGIEFNFDPKLFWIKNLQQGSHLVFETSNSNNTLAFDLKRGYMEQEDGLIKNNKPVSNFSSFIAAFGGQPMMDTMKYTGTGKPLTVRHKNKKSPEAIMIKNLDKESDWFYWQSAMGYKSFLRLNVDKPIEKNDNIFNKTPPNKYYVTLGNEKIVNRKGDRYICLLFYRSAFFSSGIYTGRELLEVPTHNNPNTLIIKRLDGIGTWRIFSSVLNSNDSLRLNSFGALTKNDDILAVELGEKNFSIKSTSPAINLPGDKYVYMAFTSV